MEAVGVIFLVRNIFDDPEFLGIVAAEGIGQRFARRAVNRKMIAVLLFPGFAVIVQRLDD